MPNYLVHELARHHGAQLRRNADRRRLANAARRPRPSPLRVMIAWTHCRRVAISGRFPMSQGGPIQPHASSGGCFSPREMPMPLTRWAPD